jgi:putative DNA methylase
MTELVPFALKDAPALIEAVFPAQKVSYEAQTERKAVQSQTLTGLGSYWKGRKPLVLVRAIILGSLLPQTSKAEHDLEIFEKLMAFDDEGLARRAVLQGALKPKEIASLIELDNPWHYFKASLRHSGLTGGDIRTWAFPIDADGEGISLTWRRGISDDEKLEVYRKVIASFDSYEAKADICKRAEEVDQKWLFAPVWKLINRHYADLGIKAFSHAELVKQLGVLRFGHRPRVGDTFSGGGSIPFEAARVGCDVYASDLNPVACMLTWGALNIVGATEEHRLAIAKRQWEIAEAVDKEITELGVEHDEYGNRAKAYLYCLEVECPETGWMVPLCPSWVVSKSRNVVVHLKPNYEEKRFEIALEENASKATMLAAEKGTAQDGALVYELDGRTYRTTIKTLRGDFRDADGSSKNRLRSWRVEEFVPNPEDRLQERLYVIQWIKRETINNPRQETYFAAVTDSDLEREEKVQKLVKDSIVNWQSDGLIPDMAIEAGDETTRLTRERGWAFWHQLFSARQLLFASLVAKTAHDEPEAAIFFAKLLDWNSKLCRYGTGAARESIAQTFYNQAFNTFLNYGVRSFGFSKGYLSDVPAVSPIHGEAAEVRNLPAAATKHDCDLWITDPPYADAVNYHEITEFFIAWLRRNPPKPFDQYVWDSRRALAIKGSGDDFRKGMVDAYRAMAKHMPDNGMQCVMFTHQDTGVWSDMVGIFWAAGLQVVAAWYIATETTSELKKGGYVQGTVILMLRKRSAGDKAGFKQRILPAVRTEVERQMESMMNLNEEVKGKLGEPVFNDSDLQMAGYAAALKVLTAYTQIGGEDVTNFALRPRQRGETTVVDEIVQQAAEAANSLLVPEGLGAETWARLSGVERFFFRMMDMETTGAKKLDNYQNFAKAFRVEDYDRIMGDMAANNARLKTVLEFASRDLSNSTEIGPTWLGQLIIGLQQLLAEVEPQVVIEQIQADMPEFMEARPLLIDMLAFIERKASQPEVRTVAEVLGARIKNLRALGQ